MDTSWAIMYTYIHTYEHQHITHSMYVLYICRDYSCSSMHFSLTSSTYTNMRPKTLLAHLRQNICYSSNIRYARVFLLGSLIQFFFLLYSITINFFYLHILHIISFVFAICLFYIFLLVILIFYSIIFEI